MRISTISAIFLSILLIAVSTAAQTSAVTPEMRASANKFYAAEDWARSVEAYDEIVKLEDGNINARYRLGLSLLNADKPALGIPYLERCMTSAPNPVYALTLTRAYARNNQNEKAFETIEKSMTVGGIAPETLVSEKDLKDLQKDPKFIDLVKRSDAVVNPCKSKPEFRQFDFWIGDWDVKTPQGAPAGSSSVQLILGQCIIFENWSGGSGTNGKSFNIFDSNDNKWHQTWVDDKGTFTHYIGGFKDGSMIVDADQTIRSKRTIARMTFTKLENGDVRQHGENSTDDGKTWTTTFDLIYSRKK